MASSKMSRADYSRRGGNISRASLHHALDCRFVWRREAEAIDYVSGSHKRNVVLINTGPKAVASPLVSAAQRLRDCLSDCHGFVLIISAGSSARMNSLIA